MSKRINTWTPEEEALLLNPKYKPKDLQKLLPNYSYDAICSRRRQLKVKTEQAETKRPWTSKEDDIVMQLDLSVKEISNLINRTESAVTNRRSQLRLLWGYTSENQHQKNVEMVAIRKEQKEERLAALSELTQNHDYKKKQLEILEQAMIEGLNPFYLLNPEYSIAQMKEIYLGLAAGFDVSCYASTQYQPYQMSQIRIGLEHNIDVSWYLNPAFSAKAMEQIRLGLEAGLAVQYYALPVYTPEQMNQLRRGLQERLPVWKYANPIYNDKQMNVFRKAIKNRIDISSFNDPTLSAIEMNARYKELYEQYRRIYPGSRATPVSCGKTLKELDSIGEKFVISSSSVQQSDALLRELEDLGYKWGVLKTNSTGILSGVCFYCNPVNKRLTTNQNRPKDGNVIAYLALVNENAPIKEADLLEEEDWIPNKLNLPNKVGYYQCLVRDRKTGEVKETFVEFRRNKMGQLRFLSEDLVLTWRPHMNRAEMKELRESKLPQQKELFYNPNAPEEEQSHSFSAGM